MFAYKKYMVRETDHFDATIYPKIDCNLDALSVEIEDVPMDYRTEMLVAYTKDRSLRQEWISANPTFTNLLMSGNLPINDIESLFESCILNTRFRQQLEDYLREKMDNL
jgi:hypothetical protein